MQGVFFLSGLLAYSPVRGANSFVQFPLEKSSSKVYNYSTRIELKGFEEAEMRDARSASQWFPPEFALEFAKNESKFGALARTCFSPRRKFEIRSEEFALSEIQKEFLHIFSRTIFTHIIN